MTDTTTCPIPEDHHGLGAIASPPDPRDWSIGQLYALTGRDAVTPPPPSFLAPAPFPPVLDQGSSPKCVAYSSSSQQAYEDLRDTGPVNLDEDAFFTAIGGTASGAVIRDAFARRLAVGYPPVAGGGSASSHRIAAYFAVPTDQLSLQSAIQTFGPVIVGTPWYHSWFHPVAGVLPAPDYRVGGHAILAIGWDPRGLRLRNSWGSDWGAAGDCWLPWSNLPRLEEAWRAVDRIDAPPAATYTLHLAPGALLKRVAAFCSGAPSPGRIQSWVTPDAKWGARASSATCHAPIIRLGCNRGQAQIAYVPRGAASIAGKWVRIDPAHGVTVTKNP